MPKTPKNCIVCGKEFNGTAKAECCGATCRKKLQRLREAGKNPEFGLIGGKKTKASPKIITQENFEKVIQEVREKQPPKYIDRMNTPFWDELRKKKLGI